MNKPAYCTATEREIASRKALAQTLRVLEHRPDPAPAVAAAKEWLSAVEAAAELEPNT
jgi:hypothetical protein